MIQSMEILQLPILALQEKIEQEMNENPMLEVQEIESDEPIVRDDPDLPEQSEQEFVVEDDKDNVDDFERLLELDQQYPDTFDERPQRSSNQMDQDAERRHDALANVEARHETLQDHLELQLAELNLEPRTAAALAEVTGDAAWQPTFVFRLGRAERPARLSPRRPLEEVLDGEEATA
jgi:RNA polymerase sigma-54 factor